MKAIVDVAITFTIPSPTNGIISKDGIEATIDIANTRPTTFNRKLRLEKFTRSSLSIYNLTNNATMAMAIFEI